MANPYASEIKWWKQRAADFDNRRARLQPLSYTYASQAYQARGNLNGASSLDSMRLSIYRQGEADRAANAEKMRRAIYVKPKSAAEKRAEEAAAKYRPGVVQPSEAVSDLHDDVDRLKNKILGVGGAVGEKLIGGMMRAFDVIQRTSYAMQNVKMQEVAEAKTPGSQGGEKYTFLEHVETALSPFVYFGAGLAVETAKAAAGNEQSQNKFEAISRGITGKDKVTGIDVLRAEYPEWAKEHNTLANIAGFATEILSDPLTYVTMGEGTIVKVAGAGGAKLLGKDILAKALLEQTVLTKTGRSAGKQALNTAIRANKTKTQAKAAAKAGKTANRTKKQAERSKLKYAAGKIQKEKFEKVAEKAGKAQAYKVKALQEFHEANALAFEGSLRGFSDVTKFIARHPFKTMGAYGQGVRTGGLAKGVAAAKAAQAKVIEDAIENAHSGAMALTFRPFHEANKGKVLKKNGVEIRVAEDYTEFVTEVFTRLGKIPDVTQYTRRAARGRYSVLAQNDAERRALVDLLGSHNVLDFPGRSARRNDNIFEPDGPLGNIIRPTARAGTTPPASAAPTEGVSVENIAESLSDQAVGFDVEQVMMSIASDVEVQRQVLPALLTGRAPDLAAIDEANQLVDEHTGIRELYKSIAKKKLDEYGIETDEAVRVAEGTTRQAGDAARTGAAHTPHYMRTRNRKIAEAINEAIDDAIEQAALSGYMSDPDVVVKAIVDTTHDILNRATADTHVQVMEFLHYKHGMSMPSMNMPVKHVDSKFADGSIYDGVAPSGRTEAIEKHFSDYLVSKVFDSPDEMADYSATGRGLVDGEWSVEGLLQELMANGNDELVAAVSTLFEQTRILNDIHYGSGRTGVVDKYTMLDHFMFGRNPLDELSIETPNLTREQARALKAGQGSIGRVAHTAKDFEFSANLSGIPAFSSEVLRAFDTLIDELNKIQDALKSIPESSGNVRAIKDADKSVEYWEDVFNKVMYVTTVGDVNRVGRFQDGVLVGFEPQKMLNSLGTHLALLQDTTEFKNFSVGWRRKIAANLWDVPPSKIDVKGKDIKEWAPGTWSSATVMADLNDAISLGILHKTVVQKMTPEQASDWIAKIAKDNPQLEAVFRQADVEGHRAGKVGARGAGAENTGADIANAMSGHNLPERTPAQAVGVSNTEDAVDAGLMARKQLEDRALFDEVSKLIHAADEEHPEAADLYNALRQRFSDEELEALIQEVSVDLYPGGFAAPSITEAQKDLIDQLTETIYADTDVVSLQRLISDANANLMEQIMMFDYRMQETLNQFQLAQGLQIRFMGAPILSIPTTTNPFHTNAGVAAMNQDLPRHIKARSHILPESSVGSSSARTADKWLHRATSRLDEGMRQIKNRISSETVFDLKMTVEAIKQTYRTFKNKDDLKVAVRGYFSPTDTFDPRLDEVEKRFNGISNRIISHARDFTSSTEIGYDHIFVQRSVATLMGNMPSRFKVPSSVMNEFTSISPAFSREWFMDLSSFLANQPSAELTMHPLAAGQIQKLDIANFEFALQHVSQKLQVRNETTRTMFETFGAPMSPEVVSRYNSFSEITARNQLVNLNEAFGKSYVPTALANHYVPRHVAEEMRRIISFMDDSMQYKRGNMNFSAARRINNAWKAGVTVFGMRYHVGNAMSDGFLNLVDGVKPESYLKAMSTIVHDPGTSELFSDPSFIKGVQSVMEPATEAAEDAAEIAKNIQYIQGHGPGKPLSVVNINGQPYTITGTEYQARYRALGLDQNNVTGNLQKTGRTMVDPVTGSVGRVADVIQEVSIRREDYFRMAHFIHAVEEEARLGGRTIDDIFLAARDRVVKYHFDYDNVTELERLSISAISPFYKWTRNIVPLAFSLYFTNPKAYTIGISANRAMGEIMFPTQEDASGNEIPADTVIPRWVTEQGAVPMEIYLDPEGNQQVRYGVLNLPLDQALTKWLTPFISPAFNSQLSTQQKISQMGLGVGASAASMLHPGIQTGIQMATGRQPFPGGSRPNENWWEPAINMIYGMTGALREGIEFGTQVRESARTGNGVSPALISDALGLTRVSSVKESSKKGELLRQKDELKPQVKKAEAAWLQRKYPGIDPESEEAKKLVHDYHVSTGTLKQ